MLFLLKTFNPLHKTPLLPIFLPTPVHLNTVLLIFEQRAGSICPSQISTLIHVIDLNNLLINETQYKFIIPSVPVKNKRSRSKSMSALSLGIGKEHFLFDNNNLRHLVIEPMKQSSEAEAALKQTFSHLFFLWIFTFLL